MTDRLLTARTVADMLDVTPATVLRWTREGEVPAVRLPSGQVRFRPAEIEAWLTGRAIPGRGSDGGRRPEDASQAPCSIC